MNYLIQTIFLLFHLISFSQSSERATFIGIGTGVDIISFKDVSSSPLAYSGFGLPLALRIKFGSNKIIHQIDISAISEVISNNYPLESNADTKLLTWDKATFNYSFLHQITNEKSYVGGSINSSIFYREYDFLDGQSYEFLSSLDINYLRRITVSDSYKIETYFSFPLLAFIHRKPSLTLEEEFLDDLHNDRNILRYGKWKTIFTEWYGFNLSVRNNMKISEKLWFTLEVGMDYYTIDFPEQVTNINYPIVCYVNYQF